MSRELEFSPDFQSNAPGQALPYKAPGDFSYYAFHMHAILILSYKNNEYSQS
jgi:hypothetical protein